ncbi:hypothetical protein [Crocinitomix catalasitica]|uniref:hypothetical protein n=1 Tax=Crocinitomix catalasitica TaxID=184607 RepID=UPI00048463D4|nr:hypothetical protein [Crocinitomix catalasitica]
MRYIFFSVLFFFLFSFSRTSIKENDKDIAISALKHCTQLYIDLKKFKIDVEYSIYYDPINFENPDDSDNGVLIRKDQNFYKKEFDNITLINRKYQLRVDQLSEVIIVQSNLNTENIPSAVNLDSLSANVSQVKKIKDGYSYYLDLPTISQIDVIYDLNGYLKIMRNYYRHPMDFGEGEVKVVTQLKYENFKMNPEIDPIVFSIEKYLNVDQNGRFKGRGDYSHYHIITDQNLK